VRDGGGAAGAGWEQSWGQGRVRGVSWVGGRLWMFSAWAAVRPKPWQLEVSVSCPQAGARRSGLLSHRRLHAMGQACAGGDRAGASAVPRPVRGACARGAPFSADSLSQMGISRGGSGFSLLVGARPRAELSEKPVGSAPGWMWLPWQMLVLESWPLGLIGAFPPTQTVLAALGKWGYRGWMGLPQPGSKFQSACEGFISSWFSQ